VIAGNQEGELMSYEINLDEVDVDGAVREAAYEVAGDTRLGFLQKAGLAGGAVMGGGAVISALAPSAFAASQKGRPPAKFGKGDIGILNYALTLEYLEAAFYNGATAAKLSLKAAKEPKFNFAGANTSTATFMKTAEVLENTGVHAYLGQVLNIKNPAYVVAAGSILTIEARHASVIGLLNEASPTGAMIAPDGPFDKPWTASKVLHEVAETKFIAG
jgi:ferritin-like protein